MSFFRNSRAWPSNAWKLQVTVQRVATVNGPILRFFYLKREEFLDPNYKLMRNLINHISRLLWKNNFKIQYAQYLIFRYFILIFKLRYLNTYHRIYYVHVYCACLIHNTFWNFIVIAIKYVAIISLKSKISLKMYDNKARILSKTNLSYLGLVIFKWIQRRANDSQQWKSKRIAWTFYQWANNGRKETWKKKI